MATKKEVQVAGPVSRKPINQVVLPNKVGLWFLVLRHLERHHKAYFPLQHHLIIENRCPDTVPSMGGVRNGSNNGDNMIPVDKSGYIDLSDCTGKEIWELMANATVRPVQPSKRLAKILQEGKRQSASAVVDLVPGMKRITSQRQQYEQATAVQLTNDGIANLNYAQMHANDPAFARKNFPL
jgi:hypothetical protein